VRLVVYTPSGLAAGIAGVMFLCRTGCISYASGSDLLMTTIAALVIGGVRHAVSGVPKPIRSRAGHGI